MTEPIVTEAEARKMEVDDLRTLLRKRGVSLARFHKALRSMLEYFLDKEEEDFLNADHTSPLGGHIYGSMVVVEEYLRGKR